MEEVILVDLDDRELGRCEKLKAHEQSLLHRAFSVFLFRGNAVLLQKRARIKYHCGGLWTNTCCSHPHMGESVLEAARRRLREELGINCPELQEVSSFVYRYPFSNGLTEYEFDHILVGEYDGTWSQNPDEVDDVRWVDLDELKSDLIQNAEQYTPWFITALGYAVDGRKHRQE